MPITQEQEKRLVSWCTARGIRANCPICGNSDWTVGEIVAAKRGEGDPIESDPGSMVQIVCDHCKTVMLFAAAQVLGEEP